MCLIECSSRIVAKLYPEAVCRIPAEKGLSAYLTFDDGPIPEVTPWVLDTLARYGVRATFFCVGDNVRKYPEVYKKIIERGHTVGNHTYHHLNGLKYATDEYLDDMRRAEMMLDTRWVRPPHGFLRPAQYNMLRLLEYKVALWDVITRDYNPNLSAERVYRNATKYVRNGSLIVFHDSVKSYATLKEVLPRTIEHLLDAGYKLLPLPPYK